MREKIEIIGEYLKLNINEVKNGKNIYEWKEKKEWIISEECIEEIEGRRIVDFERNKMNVVNFRMKVRERM